VLSLLATLSLVCAQDSEPASATLFNRVVELAMTAADEPAIDGHGPTAFAEYEVEFDGTLHIWTTSELDLFLRVDDATAGRPLASDDNSGGGTTPYLALEVEAGDWLVALVAGAPGVTGSCSLNLIGVPETDAGQAAERAAINALRKSAGLVENGERAAARELTADRLPVILGAKGSEHPDLLRAQRKLAESMVKLGDLAGALALRESIVAAFERALPPGHPDLLVARLNLASSMGTMGDISGAHALLGTVVAIAERTLPEDHPELLKARGNLAGLMSQTGDEVGAHALTESVVAGYERTLPEDHPDLLWMRANLATVRSRMGDLAGALILRQSVLAACERTMPEDNFDLVRARSDLATSVQEAGDLAGARALNESVLEAYERLLPEDHPDLLEARAALAISMESMGDSTGSRALKESVLAGYERTLPEHHPALVRARSNLALSMSRMGDLTGARALQESVVASFEHSLHGDHPHLHVARGNLANSVFRLGDFAAARALYESILVAYERLLPKDHPQRGNIQDNLASAMIHMGDLAGARGLRASVLAARERLLPEGHPDLLSAQVNMAVSMSQMGDLAGARALVRKLVAGMRTRILASLALAPRQARQTVASENSRHSEVLFFTESAGTELEGRAFGLTETMRLVVGEAARSLARFENDPELRPILAEAAEVRRALNDLVAGTVREDEDSDGLGAELTDLSLRRDRLERDASRRLAQRGVAVQPVEADGLSEALGPGDVAVGYRRVPHWVEDEESRRWKVDTDHLIAHVLVADGTLTRVDLGPASEIEEIAAAWRAALGAPLLRGATLAVNGVSLEQAAGESLRERILDPVLDAAGEDGTRVFVCADDLLFLVPLDALPDGGRAAESGSDEPDRVGDRLRIVNEVSFARLLAPAGPVKGAPSLLAFGGVDYDAEGAVPEGLSGSSAPIEARDGPSSASENGASRVDEESGDADSEGAATSRSAMPERFQKLLQARYEAEATADLFEEAFEIEPSLLTRKKTTKAALFESAAGKRYLHLATHGWFAPESVRSTEDAQPAENGFARMGIEERVSGLAPMTLCGLALAGANNGRDSLGRVPGILTAEELCSLDLSQCELAVLSACETNVGIRRAGQGIQSLQSALYAAGARTSITSLWKVDDAATRRLMEVFYTNLWIEKMGKAEALWQAKQALRDEGHPPAHWAGWVLTGDPG